ncbi:type I DNA topoisomerase [Vibrio sp. 2art]|uniref:type I DNA topoisomerase n=1 Tax=Vibrio sp. 2art TaxID=2998832 RepID=UPI0022CDA23B|nr:type I DNA topoisomerase [Vibrio sp. 2art]MDA0115946.1 type I DNA topoisomerase [Vibrio sp. 2art]
MKLMIVESPNKVKKIKGYLGEGWRVSASVGHIRDLPDKEMGIEPPDFKPKYVISSDKKKVVSELKKLASNATEVYLATDPDREGEAIAFHLKMCLGLNNPKRVTFTEITKSAITKAIQNTRTIDNHLVSAQESRRVLDRIVGYHISPLLSQQAGIPLSAGRVQSPAVKLTVLREREIREFRKRNYYVVQILLPNGLTATLDAKEWCEDGKHIFDKAVAEAIADTKSVFVSKSVVEDKESKPRAPFTTSTLQQAASSILKFTPANTMKYAQALFEQGAISYHRTDTPNLSEDSFNLVKDYLSSLGNDTQEVQLKWATKDSAQEAHEAIRPTDPAADNCGETDQQRKLYQLIRERTLASVMPPAIDIVTSIEFTSDEEITVGDTVSQAKFTVSGKIEKYPGWRSICEIEKAGASNNELSATVEEGETFSVDSKILTKTTEPPSRFTEATLIKALEKLGIGRPSTYASIMENIKSRGYIVIGDGKKKTDNKIRPTETGETLVDALDAMTFMNLDYTRILENQLDKIASGQSNYFQLVKSVYATITKEAQHIKIESLVETAECPQCGEAVKRLKSKKRGVGHFWVHISEDHNCEDFLDDDNGIPVYREKYDSPVMDCPGCGNEIKRLKKKDTEDEYFWVHSDEKHAKNCVKFIKDEEGTPVVVKDETSECPGCGKPLNRHYSKAKDFHFWVHQVQSHEKGCHKFINDEDGQPVIEQGA